MPGAPPKLCPSLTSFPAPPNRAESSVCRASLPTSGTVADSNHASLPQSQFADLPSWAMSQGPARVRSISSRAPAFAQAFENRIPCLGGVPPPHPRCQRVPYDFFSFQSHCSEKATKVQDIKNNLKEAIEVGAPPCPPSPQAPQGGCPLTSVPLLSDHRGRHEQPGAPSGAGQP